MYCNERLPRFRSSSAMLACGALTELPVDSSLEIILLALCHQIAVDNLNQFGAIDWLSNVVVATVFESLLYVVRLAAAGDHDDGNLPQGFMLPHLAASFKPVHLR